MSNYFYREKNQEKTKQLYKKRLIYKLEVRGDPNSEFQPLSLTDFSFAEKRLYGRVDRGMVPIVAKGPGAELKRTKKAQNPNLPPAALAFVIDAFEAMAKQFDKSALVGKISTTDQFLSNLIAYKGFEDPIFLYNQHMKVCKQTLVSILKNHRHAGFENFEQFMDKLMSLLNKSARHTPITLPAFIKSGFCPITVSGLTIDIADLSLVNDVEKIEKFKESLNWEFYLNACQTYGFMVDEDIPWRLVADIGSKQMLDYAAAYDTPSTTDVLSVYYQAAHNVYYSNFKRFLIEMYNYSKQSVYKTCRCKDGTLKMERIDPTDKKVEDLSPSYVLRAYCNLRFVEEESDYAENEKNRIIDDTLELARLNENTAVSSFEKILNKTFDYSGSLSYIKERLEKVQAGDSPVEDYSNPEDGVPAGELVEGGP